MPKIKNIFFDYGRTIVEHPADQAGRNIIKSFGVTDEADITLIQNEIFSPEKYANYLDAGSMEWEDYLNLLNENLPPRLKSQGISAANYTLDQLPFIVGIEDFLNTLKADGYKLYITSNLDKYHCVQLAKGKIAKYFDGFAFSSHLGVCKPEHEFFKKSCEKFGVNPAETILVDDLKENVEAAKKFGLQGFVFTGDISAVKEQIYK